MGKDVACALPHMVVLAAGATPRGAAAPVAPPPVTVTDADGAPIEVRAMPHSGGIVVPRDGHAHVQVYTAGCAARVESVMRSSATGVSVVLVGVAPLRVTRVAAASPCVRARSGGCVVGLCVSVRIDLHACILFVLLIVRACVCLRGVLFEFA